MNKSEEREEEFSFSRPFIPLTKTKAITWIVIIGFIVYFNSLFNSFVGDDLIYIINNASSHTINISHAFGTSIFNTQGQYRPIPALYFSILYILFGTNTFFYHFFQLSLHIICTIFLFILFRKFFSLRFSFLSTLVFLIHPLQVESVSYISQTVSELFFLFGMLAFFLSLKKKISVRTLLAMGLLFLLSLLTKETGVLFFLLILTYSFLFNRKNILKFLCAGISGLAIYFILRHFVGNVGINSAHLGPIATATLEQRLISMPEIIFYYIKSLIFPLYLAYDQQWVITSIDSTHFYFPLIADLLFFAAICMAGIFIMKKKNNNLKLFFFFCMWFFSGFGIITQIYPLDATVADRWFYFPLAGLLGIIGVFMQSVTWHSTIKKVGVFAGICLVLLFSVRTIIRNSNWSDGITLFSHDIKISDNPNLEGNLAYELLLANRYTEGIYYLQKSTQAEPNASDLYDLGSLYEQSHNYQKAIYYYSLSLKQNDGTYGNNEVRKNAYDGLSRILTLHQDPKNAKKFLERALKIYPKEGSYWAYLAIVDYTLGGQDEALKAAENAKTLLHNATVDKLYYRIYNKKPLNLKVQ